MGKKIRINKFLSVIALSLMFMSLYANAFAWDRDRVYGRQVVVVGHERYYYNNGRFYRPDWFGFRLSIIAPPIGAIVTNLPFGYRTVIIEGVPYYFYNRTYYRHCPYGYIVVSEPAITSNVVYAPAVIASPQPPAGETVTINVPGANGGYIPVILVKLNNGYIGLQGEYYQGHPTIEQLRALYGR